MYNVSLIRIVTTNPPLYNEYILIKGRNGGGKYVNYPDLIIA
jgi:hypothetical protein